MNLTNDENIEEMKPEFRSVHLEPCIPRSRARSNQMSVLPKSLKRNISSQSQQISKRTKAAKWAVVDAKPVPIFGLSRETRTVLINEEPIIVSSRIEDCLRLRSVKAEFDTNHSEAMCTTSDFLQYKINLYACPNNDNSTYVEVMRMGGCTVQFQKERKAIIRSAKGLGVVNMTPKFKIPSSMKNLYVAPSRNELENILETTIHQLHSSNRNTTLFALQNLAFLTNSKKAHSETARNLSRLLMKSRSGIRDMIVSIYASEASEMNGEKNQQICDVCLCILASGIDSLSKNSNFLDQECKYFIENLTPSLLQSVEKLECVHHTCLVLRCLSLLVNNSSLACDTIQRTNVSSSMKQAVELGKEEHFMLEKNAMSTMDVLQSKLIVV